MSVESELSKAIIAMEMARHLAETETIKADCRRIVEEIRKLADKAGREMRL